MEKVIIATTNMGKLKEFQNLMADLPVEVISLKDLPNISDIKETGKTFSENAFLKADAVWKQIGCLCIADDSGLEVDALNGEPGIYSARYAGERKDDSANNIKLLQAMKNIPDEKRGAQFHCSVVAIDKNGKRYDSEGILRGKILRFPQGNNGFGYDPLFFVESYGCTTAELNMDDKNKISHRGKAVCKLVEILKKEYFI